jgi:GTP-binding protein
MAFTVAILGRPNVGKSTLFNRLTGTKHALVDDQPGVTRDRRYGEANLGPLDFTLIDTAGLEESAADSLAKRMTDQSYKALDEADVAILMVDGRAGILPEDKYFAEVVRRKNIPVVLVVNKLEGKQGQDTFHDAYRLGIGEPIAVSAEHGEGMAELFSALDEHYNEEEDIEDMENPVMQISIVGRPNVGKSTLVNALLGEDRVLVGPEAGMTRDAIAVEYQFGDKKLKLMDTAGMRRKSNVREKLEKMAVGDSLRAIRYAHVVIVMLDAETSLEKQDLAIAGTVEREGRAVVVAINKWDKVKNKEVYRKAVDKRIAEVLPQLKQVPVVYISAKNQNNLEALIEECFAMYEKWNVRISTNPLNHWLEDALLDHSPPLVSNRRLKFRFITQSKTRPPTFYLSSNMTKKEVPEHYTRYLVNNLREHFDLPGVPIRMMVRKGKNPYEGKAKS